MLNLFQKPVPPYRVNPRFRAYGKARIDIAKRAATRDDWDRLWKKSTNSFPFSWGVSWKQCIEYKVTDFPAEVGFFIDILGFPVKAFDPDYAMFTGPDGEFFFSVVPTPEEEESTPPDAIRLQFMVADIIETAAELERRGVVFEHWPASYAADAPLLIGSFRTPHGIGIDLWGFDSDQDEQNIDLQPELKEEEGEIPAADLSPENGEENRLDGRQLGLGPSEEHNSGNSVQAVDLSSEDEASEFEYIAEEEN